MHLPTRPLGATGLRITTIGFGAWTIGGGGWSYGWGHTDDAESLAAMRHALDAGLNWIDTAAVYGLGHSERLVGQLLRERRRADRPHVFTKCGMVWNEHDPMEPPHPSLSPASIRRECEGSLRRLGVDCIDLYQLHFPDETHVPVEESWRVVGDLIQEGKVRFAGVSNFDTDQLERCQAVRPIESLQSPFTPVRRTLAASEIPWCAARGASVLSYSPLESGLFTDGFSRERLAALAPDDWRHQAAQFQEPQLGAALALRDRLRPVAQRHGTSVAAVVVAWVTAWPGVTAAIVGARSAAQIDDWVRAAALALTPEDLADIAAAIEASGAGSGPSAPLSEAA